MQLTRSFTLEEMLESQTARRHNIIDQFNPPPQVVDNLKTTLEKIIEPLKEELGANVQISSGYRCPKTNKLIKGAPSSQHLFGEAADIKCPALGNAVLFNKIREMKLPFDQLIWEYGTKNEPAWVHVSYGPRKRGQVLYIGVNKNGVTPAPPVDTVLTPNFHLREFKSKDGVEVPDELLPNVKELAKSLQALRNAIAEPLHLISGYRTSAYNQKLGEVESSLHLKAKAADLSCKSKSPAQLAALIEKLIAEGKMHEGGLGIFPGYLHYDIRGERIRW